MTTFSSQLFFFCQTSIFQLSYSAKLLYSTVIAFVNNATFVLAALRFLFCLFVFPGNVYFVRQAFLLSGSCLALLPSKSTAFTL